MTLKATGHSNADLAWNLVVRVSQPGDVNRLITEIDETFRNSDFETRTLTESDALAGGLSTFGDIRGIVLSLCAIVVLTVLLIAANSTAMMVRERAGEVAVMRTLGFGRPVVAMMLFGECAAIGLCGGVLGSGAALSIFGHGASITLAGGIGALWVTPASAAGALAVAFAVSLASGLAPILNVIRIPPAVAIGKII